MAAALCIRNANRAVKDNAFARLLHVVVQTKPAAALSHRTPMHSSRCWLACFHAFAKSLRPQSTPVSQFSKTCSICCKRRVCFLSRQHESSRASASKQPWRCPNKSTRPHSKQAGCTMMNKWSLWKQAVFQLATLANSATDGHPF